MSNYINSLALNKNEIEEELVNNDLLNSGGVESEDDLNEMDFNEKKELLRKLKGPKEEFLNESSSSPQSPSLCETSASNFPPLSVVGKNNSVKKLKLPRKQISTSINEDISRAESNVVEGKAEEPLASGNTSVNNVIDKTFNLPFCIDDGALPLPMPERRTRPMRNPNCVMKGENPAAALRRMLAEHDKWKTAYTAEISRLESHAIGEDEEASDSVAQRHSPKLEDDNKEDEENDPFLFVSTTPTRDRSTKVQSGSRRRESNINSNATVTSNSRQLRSLQRKSSRDSDCEEVEIIKPTDNTLGDFIQVQHQKSKRNKKQMSNQEKGRPKSVEGDTDVQFEFSTKWDKQSTGWRGTQSPSLSSLNNQTQTRRSLPRTLEVEEETVECPICQKRFPQSKVENHAATCEGFSDSPMDIEEN